ncbi:HAD-IA family hydrolase [Rhodobacterales bacterium LSUCC0031]|nr:HAD-IA family hydrolase [Rhodobacterales bacterium LSUCC0031]
MIKGLLFDKDGTLFDFQQSWGGWAHDLIMTLAADDDARFARLTDVLGYDAPNRVFFPHSLVIAGTARDQAEALAPHLPGRDLDALEVWLAEAARSAAMVPAVPLKPLLNAFLQEGFSLGIATNDAEAAARRQLELAEITDLFHFIAGYDSGFGAKPLPGMCLGFASACDLDPAHCVMVGDSLHDLEAGRAAGMRVVAVLTGVATAADLAPHADVVLRDIGQLPGWLASLG